MRRPGRQASIEPTSPTQLTTDLDSLKSVNSSPSTLPQAQRGLREILNPSKESISIPNPPISRVSGEVMALDSSTAKNLTLLPAYLKGREKEVKGLSSVSPMMVDCSDSVEGLRKQSKRKRASSDGNVMKRDKEVVIAEWNWELNELFQLYKEVSGVKLGLEGSSGALKNDVACLLEESSLPFSKLVEEIYEKLKVREGVMLSSLRSIVLDVGVRVMYGITDPEADVLEDVSEKRLWCWEAREMKVLPKIERGILTARRTIRKKIHERITNILEMMATLSVAEGHESWSNDTMKTASVKLGKTPNGKEIRALLEKLKQKNDANIVAKEAKLKEEEKNRIEHQIRKDKGQKELGRLSEEFDKEEMPHEKAVECSTPKRQQKEAERNQRRREKEEIEAKKQKAIRKQASLMERLFKSKPNINNPDKPERGSSSNDPLSDSSGKNGEVANATTTSMDCFFSEQGILTIEDLQKSNVVGWHKLRHWNRSCRWGVRRNPKIQLIKELKLQQSSSEAELSEKGSSSNTGHVASKRKLMQFDKSHRPAYYGTWHKKSDVVGPLHPFKKDPTLDYDIDSDEEWEEEDPGESLSDCDDDKEGSSDEENLVEDENEDGFFVSDGFPLEDEVFLVDVTSDAIQDEARYSSYNPQLENEEFKQSLRYQMYLHNLTEQALRKDQPLVISNLMHEKSELVMAKDLNGIAKLEMMCLQALRMQASPGGSVIDIPTSQYSSSEDQQVCQSQSRKSSTPKAIGISIPDSYLPEFVRRIQSNSSGISKIVESLHSKFPAIPKSQLNNCVREISDFVDNRWQVKNEILSRFRMNSPVLVFGVDISEYSYSNEDQQVWQSQSLTATATSIPDSDLPEYVRCILANSSGISKIVESLHRKFPGTPKLQLNNWVREISFFGDNRWQVKRDILSRMGLLNLPDKCGKVKGIGMLSKCSSAPKSRTADDSPGSSLQLCSKMETHHGDKTHILQTDKQLTSLL